jgi:multicomponent Na+:H+ antiporter subunit A
MYPADVSATGSPPPLPLLLLHWLKNGGAGWLLGLVPLSLVIWFASMIPAVTAGQVLELSYEWVPSLGVSLSFTFDGLGLLFALIVSGVGTLIIIYAGGYMVGDPQVGRFYLYLFLFMFSMLGLVLADNIVTLFVFWELTSITSYLLIGFKHAYESSRKAALQALLVTGGGGLAMLGGLVLLALVGGSLELSELIQQGSIASSPFYMTILLLVLFGCFTKSAQFPFHFWLPSAMAAPTPVSAYLHSATMVKAGVYLLARLTPVLGGTFAWEVLLTTFGAITMLFGAYLAVLQVDLKRILAFTTVSALGTLVMLLGIGTDLAVKGAMVFLVVHSLYKGGLFMVAGAIDHESGTRDILDLGGLKSLMPITAVAGVLAAISMSGMPPFFGFIGKEVMYEAARELPVQWIWVLIIAVLSNILMIVSAGMAVVRPFFGPRRNTPKTPHEAPPSMWLGPLLLGAVGLAFGLLPEITISPMVEQAVGAVLNEEKHLVLHLIPDHFSGTVVLSIITIVGGLVAYFYGLVVLRHTGMPSRSQLENYPVKVYDWMVEGMQAVAQWQTRTIQSGYLRYYLRTVIAVTVVLTLVAFLGFDEVRGSVSRLWPTAYLHEWIIAIIMLAAAVFIVISRKRLPAVIGLGVVGIGMALIFTLHSAPDLAMTQFSIETLSVILLVLVLYRLPKFSDEADALRRDRIRDAIVAIGAGVLMTILVMATAMHPLDRTATPYFAEHSYDMAYGKNVVNVILVDFRALDTMGEISVIAIAAIGIVALLKLRPKGTRDDEQTSQKQEEEQ